MAHFAQLDENNIVKQVIVVNNTECVVDGIENEEAGVQFCKSLFGSDTIWKQTSYNGSIRKNYASVGLIYDEVRDAFINSKPVVPEDMERYVTFNELTCLWEYNPPLTEEQLQLQLMRDSVN